MNKDMLGRLLVVDTETTGANIFENGILSYAFVPFVGGSSLEGYVDDVSGCPWSPVAESYFSNFEAEWREGKKSPRAAVIEIENYIERISGGQDMIMIGHNVAFDRYFLEKLAHQSGRDRIKGISHRTIDTHSILISLHIAGKIPAWAVSSSGAFQYFGVVPKGGARHTALGDALATRELFGALIDVLGDAALG